MRKFNFNLWLARLCVSALALALAACTDSTPPEPDPDPVNLQISFDQPGTFRPGETKEVPYTLPQDQPASITATDVPEGWEVTVNTVTQKFLITSPETGVAAVSSGIATIVLTSATDESAQADLLLEVQWIATFGNGVAAAAQWGGGDGTEASPWEIWTPEQLRKLVEDVDNEEHFVGKYFKLMVDVEVTADEWMPIGTRFDESYFSGSFDGNGMTISGQLKSDNHYLFGFFGNVWQAGDIKDLTVTADVTNGYEGYDVFTGAIAGILQESGTLLNCRITGSVTGGVATYEDGVTGTGGVAGAVFAASISGCTIEGATVTGGDAIGSDGATGTGGVAGTVSAASISGCTIEGATVTGGDATGSYDYTRAGGVAGYAFEASISGCTVDGATVIGGDATGEFGYTWAGGLVGKTYRGEYNTPLYGVNDCSVTEVRVIGGRGTGHSFTGGLCGENEYADLTDCSVTGTVNGGSALFLYTGGVSGENNGSVTTRAAFSGTVKGGQMDDMGESYTGGIAGNHYYSLAELVDCTVAEGSSVTGATLLGANNDAYNYTGGIAGCAEKPISGCTNHASVNGGEGTWLYTGGVIGYLTAFVHTSTNTGAVTSGTGAEAYTGGLAGYVNGGSIYNCCRNTGTVDGVAASGDNVVGYPSPFTFEPCTEGHTTYALRVPLRASASVSAVQVRTSATVPNTLKMKEKEAKEKEAGRRLSPFRGNNR